MRPARELTEKRFASMTASDRLCRLHNMYPAWMPSGGQTSKRTASLCCVFRPCGASSASIFTRAKTWFLMEEAAAACVAVGHCFDCTCPRVHFRDRVNRHLARIAAHPPPDKACEHAALDADFHAPGRHVLLRCSGGPPRLGRDLAARNQRNQRMQLGVAVAGLLDDKCRTGANGHLHALAIQGGARPLPAGRRRPGANGHLHALAIQGVLERPHLGCGRQYLEPQPGAGVDRVSNSASFSGSFTSGNLQLTAGTFGGTNAALAGNFEQTAAAVFDIELAT